MRSGFRFDPPRVEAGVDLRWLLWRAFGPAGEGYFRIALTQKKERIEEAIERLRKMSL